MTNIIKIKRSATTATPASLQEGELAYSEQSGNLFIGTNGGLDVSKIGGNTDVLALSNHIADTSNPHSTTLALLTDVDVNGSPTLGSGDLLQYNGTKWRPIPSSSVGVTDHGALTGLGDDDHPQYAKLAGDTFTGNVIIGGDLTVNGTTTTVNSTEVNIGDNIIVLNSGNGSPPVSANGGIEINRGGLLTNASLIWDETADVWKAGLAGSETEISLVGHTHAASDITSGTFADARIAESNVTQHEAALTITESQISDLNHTTTLDELTDVTFDASPSLVAGDLLQYNGTNWTADNVLDGGTF